MRDPPEKSEEVGMGCVVEEHAVKLGKREGIAHLDGTYRTGLCARVREQPYQRNLGMPRDELWEIYET